MNKALKIGLTIVAIFIIATINPIVSLAQPTTPRPHGYLRGLGGDYLYGRCSQETRDYIREAQQRINGLYEAAQKYYNDSVKPIEEAISLILESSDTQAEEAKKRDLQKDSIYYINFIHQNISHIDSLKRRKELISLDGLESTLDIISNISKEINRLTAENDSLKSIYYKIKDDLAVVNSRITNISNFDELDQKRYDRTEVWYDIHEELDKELINICQYCLSQPYDNDFVYLKDNVTPLLDKVYHKSYTARINQYRDLLTNYSKYTKEIYDFLRDKEGYTNLNGTNFSGTTYATQLQNDFNSLTYVKNYYSQRNDPKGVYSPYLNNVLQQ